jgi:hypothetical protein
VPWLLVENQLADRHLVDTLTMHRLLCWLNVFRQNGELIVVSSKYNVDQMFVDQINGVYQMATDQMLVDQMVSSQMFVDQMVFDKMVSTKCLLTKCLSTK